MNQVTVTSDGYLLGYLTISEFCKQYDRQRTQLYKLINNGKINSDYYIILKDRAKNKIYIKDFLLYGYITVDQYAKKYGLKKITIQRYIKDNTIDKKYVVNIGSLRLINIKCKINPKYSIKSINRYSKYKYNECNTDDIYISSIEYARLLGISRQRINKIIHDKLNDDNIKIINFNNKNRYFIKLGSITIKD